MTLSIWAALILIALAGPALAQSSHQGQGTTPALGAAAPMGQMGMGS